MFPILSSMIDVYKSLYVTYQYNGQYVNNNIYHFNTSQCMNDGNVFQ